MISFSSCFKIYFRWITRKTLNQILSSRRLYENSLHSMVGLVDELVFVREVMLTSHWSNLPKTKLCLTLPLTRSPFEHSLRNIIGPAEDFKRSGLLDQGQPSWWYYFIASNSYTQLSLTFLLLGAKLYICGVCDKSLLTKLLCVCIDVKDVGFWIVEAGGGGRFRKRDEITQAFV